MYHRIKSLSVQTQIEEISRLAKYDNKSWTRFTNLCAKHGIRLSIKTTSDPHDTSGARHEFEELSLSFGEIIRNDEDLKEKVGPLSQLKYKEAIVQVHKIIRPAILVKQNKLDFTDLHSDSQVWNTRLSEKLSNIENYLHSVGRVNDPGTGDWHGTAWMIAADIAVTNKHVVNNLTTSHAVIDFGENDSPNLDKPLGGNSGSVVFDFHHGKAVGLHFQGAHGVENDAICASKLREILDLTLKARRTPAVDMSKDDLVQKLKKELLAAEHREDYKACEDLQGQLNELIEQEAAAASNSVVEREQIQHKIEELTRMKANAVNVKAWRNAAEYKNQIEYLQKQLSTISPSTQEMEDQIKQLEEQEKDAVSNRNYKEAQTIRDRIESLKKQLQNADLPPKKDLSDRIRELEKQEQEAVQKRDYELAAKLKQEINNLQKVQ